MGHRRGPAGDESLKALPRKDLLMLLATILEQIPAQVALISSTGDVLVANHQMWRLLEEGGDGVRRTLAHEVATKPGRFALHNGRTAGWVFRIRPHFDVAACEARASHVWSLTPRQGAVLRLLLEGCSNAQIAATLGCKENTVEVHVTAIFRKSRVRTRSQVVLRALELASHAVYGVP